MADLSFDDLIPRSPYADAIASIESKGSGNYMALGPTTRTGDRAYGRYQVMRSNIGPWSTEILGREVTPQEFMQNPALQDAIFNGKFGQYVQKYGPEGAAKAWFAGEKGMHNPNARDQLGTSVADYAAKFNQAAPQQAMAFASQPSPSFPPSGPQPAPDLSFDDLIPQQQPVDPMAAAREQLAAGLRAGKSGDQDVYRTAAFRTNQGVPAATAGDLAANQFLGGFGDEASAAFRAPIDMALRGEGFDEAYQHNLAAERDRMEQYRKANPIKAAGAEIIGAMGAMPARGGAVKAGLMTGALYGAGNSEGDLAQRASDAAVGGLVSGALGGVVSGAGKLLAGKAPSAAPSIQELKASAKAKYKSDAIREFELAPETVSHAATRIRALMDAEGFDEVIGTKAHAILKRLENIPPGASAVTGLNLHSLQKTLGKAAGSTEPSERAAAVMALREFNNFLETLPAAKVVRGSGDDFMNTMRSANADYAAAMQAGNIDKKLVQAQIRAGAANSGMNVGNTIRQRMADVVLNPKQHRGLKADELEAAKQISQGTKLENAMRFTGNMLGGGGGLGTLAASGVGMGAAAAAGGDASSSPYGLALPALGFALRGMGNRMTTKQAEKLSEMIRSRAPLASATTKFEERIARFYENRNAKTASAAALAARNLSTNLKDAGFSVSVNDLLRAIQGPVAGRAEDEQR